MTTQKNETTKPSAAPDTNRRNIALNLLGLLGGSALLKACAMPESGESAPDERVATAIQGLTGTNLRWADTVFGSGGPLSRNGDLNNAPQGAPAPHVMIVKGAETPGDGGGGVFYWDSTPGVDDGGTVIVPQLPAGTTGCWRRIYDGPLNIKWFGTSNATLAIQNAIYAAANSAQSGGRVYVPPGKHIITKTIAMASNVELFGAGVSSELELHLGSISGGDYDGVVLIVWGDSNARISNLKINGNKALNATWDIIPPSGIVLAEKEGTPCIGCVVENCIVTECLGSGISLVRTQKAKVFGCSVTNNGTNGVLINNAINSTVQSSESMQNGWTGVYVDGADTFGVHVRDNRTDSIVVATSQVSVVGCRIKHTAKLNSDAAIVISTFAADPPPSYVTVANCHINSDTIGIRALGNASPGLGNVIHGNSIAVTGPSLLSNELPAGVELFLQADASVTSNNIRGDKYEYGVRCRQSHHVSISDNSIALENRPSSPLHVFGVILDGSQDTTVTGNSIRGFIQAVMELPPDHNIVSANILRANDVALGTPSNGSIYEHNIV